MGITKQNIIGFILIFISILLIVLSFLFESQILLIIGGISLVVSTFLFILLSSLEMFKKDKILDLEELKKSGLHIVTCTYCSKKNVLEDKFCIFCGEKLVKEDE